MAIKKKYPALGRGLDALISTEDIHIEGSGNICEVPVERIHPNADQPRRDFDDDALQELANSIRQIGIIQPITLRDMGDDSYVIIAGERRWRASQRAGLTHIPAYIRTVDDENMMEMALVENIQREDLTALEVALAYQNLIEKYGLTQEQLSDRVGKNRATVTNYLRLLKLPAPIQMALKNREIEMAHARTLLSLDDPTLQLKVFNELRKDKMSVRRIEEMVKELNQGGSVKTPGGKRLQGRVNKALAAEYTTLKESLSKLFQTKVQLTCSDTGKGKISIPFANAEELERIIVLLDQMQR